MASSLKGRNNGGDSIDGCRFTWDPSEGSEVSIESLSESSEERSRVGGDGSGKSWDGGDEDDESVGDEGRSEILEGRSWEATEDVSTRSGKTSSVRLIGSKRGKEGGTSNSLEKTVQEHLEESRTELGELRFDRRAKSELLLDEAVAESLYD